MIVPSRKQKVGITKTAYAKKCQVSRETIRQWERKGYLVLHDDGTIDAAASDARKAGLLRPKADRPSSAMSGSSPDEIPEFNVSRARKLAAEAALAELRLEEERGRLVDAHDVKRLLYEIAARVRDGVQAIPARHTASLAAISDEHEVRRRLGLACDDALRDLASQVEAFAATVPEGDAK